MMRHRECRKRLSTEVFSYSHAELVCAMQKQGVILLDQKSEVDAD
jgi:hypothetical protein